MSRIYINHFEKCIHTQNKLENIKKDNLFYSKLNILFIYIYIHMCSSVFLFLLGTKISQKHVKRVQLTEIIYNRNYICFFIYL